MIFDPGQCFNRHAAVVRSCLLCIHMSYVYSFLLSLSNFREKFTKSVVYFAVSGILCEQ